MSLQNGHDLVAIAKQKGVEDGRKETTTKAKQSVKIGSAANRGNPKWNPTAKVLSRCAEWAPNLDATDSLGGELEKQTILKEIEGLRLWHTSIPLVAE